METNSITYDLLKAIHTEIKIAVQNHQFLVLRKKMCPTDPDVENHINVTQGLIISLGRTQAELLSQLRKEPGFSDLKIRLQTSPNFVPKGVPYPQLSKYIPIYKANNINNNNNNNNNEKTKKIGVIRYNRRDNIIQIQKGTQQSLLKYKGEKVSAKNDNLEAKIIDGTKIKLVYNKKNDSELSPSSLLKNPKKQQMSVLKSKNDKGKYVLISSDDNVERQNIICNEKYENIGNNQRSDINNHHGKGELSVSVNQCLINDDSKSMKTSPTRSASNSDESEISENIVEKPVNNREPKLVKKYDTRFVRKKKYDALLLAAAEDRKASLKSDVDSKDRLDGDSSGNETNEIKPLLPEDIGQELYLGYFGLVSKAKGDVLKRKRCERKRRSVAGQSSLYSDYYQPVSSKRTYVKKSTSSPTSPTNQVIVETAVELDDEDEKPKYCMVCNEPGLLEICQSCSGTYHEKCNARPTNGCPNCSPQPTDINSIVGANFFASSSSYEIIKRYSVPNNETPETDEGKNDKVTESSKECVSDV